MYERLFLQNATSIQLYEQVKALPIIDYHNHLNVNDIIQNRKYESITELWLTPDPYKHRLMRMLGVEENKITGNASDKEKFFAWCNAYPHMLFTPVAAWARLELDRVFGITAEINGDNAEYLWGELNERLSDSRFTSNGILKRFNIEYSSPCCSIKQDIAYMSNYADLAPSLRGDDMCAPTLSFIGELGEIRSLNGYFEKLSERIEVFHRAGCRFSDHALDNGFRYYRDDGKNSERFDRLLQGESIDDMCKLTSHLLRFVAGEYQKHGWTMQLHIGAERSTSTRLKALAGAQGGFAGIGNSVDVKSLTSLLDDLEKANSLPKTILFTLNPADDAIMSILSGSYSRDNISGLIVQGPAWWWCDHVSGIKGVLDSVSDYGMLYNFPGMTTDSRSILSFVRHEYFRRVLCSFLGERAERDGIATNNKSLFDLADAICYKNAKSRIEVK